MFSHLFGRLSIGSFVGGNSETLNPRARQANDKLLSLPHFALFPIKESVDSLLDRRTLPEDTLMNR